MASQSFLFTPVTETKCATCNRRFYCDATRQNCPEYEFDDGSWLVSRPYESDNDEDEENDMLFTDSDLTKFYASSMENWIGG
jgi:hypothetical protein